jgi:hypothetical protein
MSTPGVVRVGGTVRRPVKPDATYVHVLRRHFERCGFDGAPRYVGTDERGRAVFTFIEGFAPPHNGFRLSEEALRAGGRLLRAVHDLTAGNEFAAGSEVACHPSLAQPNFVFRNMVPVAIIEWDGTKPGSRRTTSATSSGLVAISGKSRWRESRENKPRPLPWVATACRAQRMVRRGSIARKPFPRLWRTTGAHPSICSSFNASLGYANRRSVVPERQRRAPAQPVFHLGDRNELQASAANPT